MQAWELERELGKAQDKLNAINLEIKTYHERRMTIINHYKTAPLTIELIEKILDGSYFDVPSCSDTPTEVIE